LHALSNTILQVARDDANISKGYGFVSFSNFESSDEAIANMHGQFLANKEITVQYAYKKDGKGERHGDAAERLLASQAREHNVEVPTQQGMQGLFNPNQVPLGGPVQAPPTPMAPGMNGGFNAPPGFGNGVPPPQSPYGQAPMPMHAQMGRPGIINTPLPPAPAGLPARPPPSLGGYGGPPGGYQQQAPPGFAPPGFAPNAPPGFQQPPYGNGMPPGFGR
jgi:splicing factor 3B subunit 4